jgi:hypothetical protein
MGGPRDKLTPRGAFCGITMPGLPLKPGMGGYTVNGWRDNKQGGLNPPIMALDVPRYWKDSPELVDEYLTRYASFGYTHLQCSIGHAIEAGLSLDDYIAYSARVESFNLFTDHWFLGGGPWRGRLDNGAWTEHRDRDRAHWSPIFDPWIDALLSNKVISCACVGWQLDGSNTNDHGELMSIIEYFADRLGPHDIPIGTHWVNEAGAWDERGRFWWWQNMRNKVLWFNHQGNTGTPIPEYQAKLVDTLNPFGDGRMGTSGLFGDRPYSLILYECSAQARFDLVMSEDESDQRGYYLSCTMGKTRVGGYGDGCRLPDGSCA